MVLSWHIAETREKAREEAGKGLMRWHNEYIVGTLQRPGAKPFKSIDDALDKTADSPGSAATIGTPDDLVKTLKGVIDMSGGLGTIVGFAHDWANIENTFRSWEMVARYVIPEINGYLTGLRRSQQARDRQPRVVRAGGPGGDGEDHGKRQGRRRVEGDAQQSSCRLRQQCPGFRESGRKKESLITTTPSYCESTRQGQHWCPCRLF